MEVIERPSVGMGSHTVTTTIRRRRRQPDGTYKVLGYSEKTTHFDAEGRIVSESERYTEVSDG